MYLARQLHSVGKNECIDPSDGGAGCPRPQDDTRWSVNNPGSGTLSLFTTLPGIPAAAPTPGAAASIPRYFRVVPTALAPSGPWQYAHSLPVKPNQCLSNITLNNDLENGSDAGICG